jgi:hypothetical protein
MIDDVSDYLTNKFYFIHKEEFQQSYLDYQSGKYFENGQNMLVPKNYVFSFSYGDDLYELYAIDKNSKYTLLTFNIDTKLIGCVEYFNNHEDALEQMKKNYSEIFDEEMTNTSEILTIPHNGSVFGMVFKCNIDFFSK